LKKEKKISLQKKLFSTIDIHKNTTLEIKIIRHGIKNILNISGPIKNISALSM
jgi:hypothetical protein